MVNVLIVYAHPEPRSFNGALRDLAVATLKEQGHEVKVSDLYAMNFKAVADRGDFMQQANPDFFKYQAEQQHAHLTGTLSPDITAEHEKLQWADTVIFQFPLWWFTVPAILKGWFDRVFTMGFVYGGGKWYDKGGLQGKKAMLSVTVGNVASAYSTRGINGDINAILFPIHHGMLFFSGMEVLEPFLVWGINRVSDEERKQYLSGYKERLMNLNAVPSLRFHPLADYDEHFELKADVVPL
jgi:NAD(P)H dehydrogenase (quinone)